MIYAFSFIKDLCETSQPLHGLPNPAYVVKGDLIIDVDVTLEQACQFERGSGPNLNSNLTSSGPNTRAQCHALVIRHIKLLHMLQKEQHKFNFYVFCRGWDSSVGIATRYGPEGQ